MSEINQSLRDKAAVLKAGLTIDPKTGVGQYEEGTFEKSLPAEMTIQQVKDVVTVLGDTALAAEMAVGEAGTAIMKKHHGIDRVEASLPTVGKDSIEVTFQRSNPTRNPKTGEEGIKYGRSTTAINMYAIGDRGQHKLIREELANNAMAALAPKK